MVPTKPQTATILLVEDNPGDAELAREALENSKFINQLHVAEDGVKAMAFLHRQEPYTDAPRPDIILLDLNLPKKDGREVLAEIKSDEKLKSIPVVILTSSKADEDVIRSYKLHANCYIAKPLDITRFFDVVNNIKEFWMSIVVLPHKGE
ncbi:response regulator [uncultured Desulfobacter sp.]|uniref:response regulator n=1 Tax=uncultured Desulfobacter sp. TaxID=240139 RepID=UPI002AAC1CC2|nr:response regulator [uncultured Desulfobacter sp.]